MQRLESFHGYHVQHISQYTLFMLCQPAKSLWYICALFPVVPRHKFFFLHFQVQQISIFPFDDMFQGLQNKSLCHYYIGMTWKWIITRSWPDLIKIHFHFLSLGPTSTSGYKRRSPHPASQPRYGYAGTWNYFQSDFRHTHSIWILTLWSTYQDDYIWESHVRVILFWLEPNFQCSIIISLLLFIWF